MFIHILFLFINYIEYWNQSLSYLYKRKYIKLSSRLCTILKISTTKNTCHRFVICLWCYTLYLFIKWGYDLAVKIMNKLSRNCRIPGNIIALVNQINFGVCYLNLVSKYSGAWITRDHVHSESKLEMSLPCKTKVGIS
jgi:hypothetical protein